MYSLPSLHRPGVGWPNFLTPLPDGFVGDDYPARIEQILDIAIAQIESVIVPDGVADDCRRVRVAPVRDLVSVYVPSLTAATLT